MRRIWLCIVFIGFAPVLAPAASAATVGQLFIPVNPCSDFTDVQTGVASGNSYTVPFSGFIVSWAFLDGATPVENLKLKVVRPVGANQFKVIGEAAAGAQVPSTVNTYPSQIQVATGDLIGIHAGPSGDCVSPGTAADTNIFAAGDVPLGTTTMFSSDSHARFPVSAQLEPPCVVPKLKGKRLKTAKRRLRGGGCGLGRVSGQGRTVKKQSAAPGTMLPLDSPISVRLA